MEKKSLLITLFIGRKRREKKGRFTLIFHRNCPKWEEIREKGKEDHSFSFLFVNELGSGALTSISQ